MNNSVLEGRRFTNIRTGEKGVIGERVRRRHLVFDESDMELTHVVLHYTNPCKYEMKVPLTNFDAGYYEVSDE